MEKREVLCHQFLTGKAGGEACGDVVAVNDDHQALVINRDKLMQVPRGGLSMVDGVFPIQQLDGCDNGHRYRADQEEQ